MSERFQQGSDTGEVIPASTVVVIRDVDGGGIETLMLRKNAKLAFGGMWVFPGGRIDAGDGEGEDGARNAAVREALEEADLVVEPGSLEPFAHWTPPSPAPKRFATWFFLAPAPAVHEVTIDGGEIHEHLWVSPQGALDRHAAGEIELAPPTWVTLHALAGFTDVASAMTWAAGHDVELYETRIGRSNEGLLVTLWHGDSGYESGDADAAGPRHRLTMAESGAWLFERDA